MNTAVGRLVRAELRLMTRDPLVLTFVFAFPIVTMLIIGGAFGTRPDPAFDGTNVYVSIGDVSAKPPYAPGGVTALNPLTGDIVWQTPAPEPVCSWGPTNCSKAQPSGVTAIPGLIFVGSWDGHMRGYDAKDGKIVWDYDTAQTWDGGNGCIALRTTSWMSAPDTCARSGSRTAASSPRCSTP